MNPSLGEVSTSAGLSGKVFYPFRLSGEQDERWVRGEITVPADFAVRRRGEPGFHVQIPYTPLYKELLVRLRLNNGTGHPEYFINSTDNTTWFPVYLQDSEGTMRPSGSPNTRPSTKMDVTILSFGTAAFCYTLATRPIWKLVPPNTRTKCSC